MSKLAEQALKEWKQTEPLPVSSIEEHGFINGYKWALRQTNPLTDREITEVFDKCFPTHASSDVIPLIDFARAIEERHGIK